MKTPMLIMPNWMSFRKAEQKLFRFCGTAQATYDVDMWNGMNNYFVQDGIAMIPIYGALWKGGGYPDQSELRALVQKCEADPNVSGCMFVIDSPGGTVAGTEDLALSIEGMTKPCYAYIEDLGASAAYWVASACDKVFSNRAIVGSIGVISELVDASEYYKQKGIVVHQIVTGDFKGVGDESQPATQEKVDYLQEQIDAIGTVFFKAVAKNRGIAQQTIRDMQAKVFHGQAAVDAGLVDEMTTFDVALNSLRKNVKLAASRKAKAQELIKQMA